MEDKKEKILIVHNYYQLAGGEDTVVANEKKLLEDNGHEVILYSRHNSELKEFNVIRKILLPLTSIFSVNTYREIKKIIVKEQIDIVHVHNTLTLISPSVYYAALHCKKPVVQTIHNFRIVCPGATFYRDGHICEDCVSKGMKCAVKHGCYRGSKLQTLLCVISTKIHRMTGVYKKINYICLTEFNKEKLLHHGQIKEEQIFVKPNFVEASVEGIPYEERGNHFVFVGRLEELKGIDVLLEAWKTLNDKSYKLIICGYGPMEEWCRTFVIDNNLTNVELKANVPNIEVRKIMGTSKALILPTQCYEGFPMTMVEAWSVGTPVIGSEIGNVGNLIEEQINGIKFQHNSPSELVLVVHNMNEDSAKEYGKNSRWIYEMKFSNKENYELVARYYNLCCK